MFKKSCKKVNFYVYRSRVRHAGTAASMTQSRFASKRSDGNLSVSRRSVVSDAKLGDTKAAVGHRLGITVSMKSRLDIFGIAVSCVSFTT